MGLGFDTPDKHLLLLWRSRTDQSCNESPQNTADSIRCASQL